MYANVSQRYNNKDKGLRYLKQTEHLLLATELKNHIDSPGDIFEETP